MQNINELSQVQLQITPVSNEHYALDMQVELSQNQVKQLKKYQYVMLAIEYRSGLETQNFKSLKSLLLNLIFQLKQRHVSEIGIFWNNHVFEAATAPNKEISDFIDQIAQDGKKNQEQQFSYTQTLISLRHKIANIQKSLTNKHQLFVLFLSTQLALSTVLEDLSLEQAYMKWLFARNTHQEKIDEQEARLKKKLLSLPCQSVVHSVGFGKYHDSNLLQRLVRLSHYRGNYFSATSIKQVSDILNLFSIIASGQITSISVSFVVSETQVPYFTLTSDEKCRVFKRKEGTQFIDQFDAFELMNLQDTQPLKRNLFGLRLQQYQIKIVIKKLQDISQQINLRLNYIDYLLLKIIYKTQKIIIIQRQKDQNNQNKYIYVQYFDEQLLKQLLKQKQYVGHLFEQIVEMIKTLKMGKKSQFIDRTNTIRDVIIRVQQIFANIYQKKFSYLQIGQLIGETSKLNIKRSLKKKLLKRINSNPSLLQDAYRSINNSLDSMKYIDVDAKYSHYLKEVGNCQYTGNNFVKAMFNEDCLAVAFTIYRPKVAIADPGRIKVKQVFHYPVSTANYISDYRLRNVISQDLYDNKKQCFMNQQLGLRFKIEGDKVIYIDNPGVRNDFMITQTENGYLQFPTSKIGILPLYICQQNWKIAKQLMKPALGWSVCDEPLAYATTQLQILPFLVLQGFIKENQSLKYNLDELDSKIEQFLQRKKKLQQVEKALDGVVTKQQISPYNKQVILTFYSQNKFNRLKLKQIREDIRLNLKQHNLENFHLKETAVNQLNMMISINSRYLKLVQQTCQRIINQLSSPYSQLPFNKLIRDNYFNYKDPINRTVDVIPNNFSFIAQIYCLINSQFMEKPSEQNFHYFFQRLVEEELRRETDAWKEQYQEECFVNKLLNVQIQKIDHPTVIALGSTYRDKFQAAIRGESIMMNQIQQKRQMIQLNIKKENTWNVVQRMALIEYKRLYESTALRLWYTRFRIYKEIQRKTIHKWKSIGMLNSYNIFAMLIQNKTQRKNAQRREIILAGKYVDPFDYQSSIEFIQTTFHELREKVLRRNVQATIAEIFNNEAQTFAFTADPVEAAGVLLDNTIGRKISKFYEVLLHNNSPLIHLKLNMILTGHYQDIQLFTHSKGWVMNKKKTRRLALKYPQAFEKYGWMM